VSLSLIKQVFLSRKGEDDAYPSAETPWGAEVTRLLLQVSESVNNDDAEDIHSTGAQPSGRDHSSSKSWCKQGERH